MSLESYQELIEKSDHAADKFFETRVLIHQNVGGDDFYIDLLFYDLNLRS